MVQRWKGHSASMEKRRTRLVKGKGETESQLIRERSKDRQSSGEQEAKSRVILLISDLSSICV